MSKLEDIIRNRRSIRKYRSKEVLNSDIDKLIEAIRWSPSWTNSQCWEIVIIKDSEIKRKLQKTLPIKGNPAKDAIIQAPVLIAMCAKTMKSGYYKKKVSTKFGDWLMYDLGIATQNLCLMAHDIGLATVIVGLYDHEKAGKIINLPQGYELVTIIPVGYPLIDPSKISIPIRRDIDDIVHNDTF